MVLTGVQVNHLPVRREHYTLKFRLASLAIHLSPDKILAGLAANSGIVPIQVRVSAQVSNFVCYVPAIGVKLLALVQLKVAAVT